jgi:DNA topoisomerase-2
MWVFDEATKEVVYRPCTYVPGLYKIFDEIVVNAADNKQRDPGMNKIEVTIDAAANSIRVLNNGAGIPVVMHQEHQIYVPELIFGHLLTGSNFDDAEQKTTGGRNGFGAKLANIFSTHFTVETVDSSRGLKFKQNYSNNMTEREAPVITKCSGTDYTCVTFQPDLERFKMDRMDEDMVALLSKRVYDIAGTNTASGAKLNVFLNGEKVEIRNFDQYIGRFKGLEAPCAFEKINDRWEVGVSISDGSFQQVSYVNSICTTKGGQHVNYIVDQITARLINTVKKKNKGEEVKATHIKNHIAVYVNALIVNPAFDSQTKETLTTKASNFGSTCVLPDKMLKKIETSGVVDNILSWAKFKQNAELKKKGGSKKSKLLGITKLDDANCAGTAKSRDCTLILTEGDSAKALAISGLGVVGRDYYGVFPLKGKLLNVREAAHAQIMKNEEIQNVAKILGLTFGKVYEDTSSLRYGHLMIMADQDHDGSHIKGLLINFLHHFWPSLLEIDGFLQQFITPIVKCVKGKKDEVFYTIPEYKNWREENNEGKGWKIKYYKGLGTSTAAEAKDYFSNLSTHEIDFSWEELSGDAIDMAFSKKRVDERKTWLLALDPKTHIDYNVESVSYSNFINQELILFSHADNSRSLPHFMDGFKPSQRKVLFSCIKRNLKNEIKVAQLAGYVSEQSAYHHGEASLTQTIVGMAQNFVGSNNINLLSPCGQFGTRLMSGKDAASPRYVFTRLELITRCIFHPDDDALLNYLDEDGQSIEPEYYVPIIPMVLVNGSEGIGTGWSSSVPTYNPRDLVTAIRSMIDNDGVFDQYTANVELKPWFRGFNGSVDAKNGKDVGSYCVSGVIEQQDEQTVVITELPAGKSTMDYKAFLENSLIGNTGAGDGSAAAQSAAFVKDFRENHTDTTVLFTVTVPAEKLAEIIADRAGGGIMKKFKLESSVSTSNMHLFDETGMIAKFPDVTSILSSFYELRQSFYLRRKGHLMGKLTEEWEKLDNKVRFILAVIYGELIVSNRKKVDIVEEMKQQRYKTFSNSTKKKDATIDEEGDEEDESNGAAGYDYLLSMKIWSLTLERVQALTAERDEKKDQLEVLSRKLPQDLWLADLDALESAMELFEAEIVEGKRLEIIAQKKAGKAAKAKRAGGGTGRAKQISKRKAAARGSDSEADSADDLSDGDSDYGEVVSKKKAPAAKAPKAKPAPITTYFPSTGTTSAAPAKAPKAVAAAKPAAAAPAPRVVEKPAPAPVKEAAPLTLAQRLLARMNEGAAATAPAITATVVEADDDDIVFTVVKDKKAPAPKKAAAPRKAAVKKAVVMSDSEEEDKFSFDEDSGSEFEEEKVSRKRPVKSSAPAPKATKARGGSKASAISVEPFSPCAASSPQQMKKARPASDLAPSTLFPNAAPAPAAKKAAPVKKAPAAAKTTKPKPAAKAAVPARKKKIVESESEEEEAFEVSDDDNVGVAANKPSRARKATNYAQFYDDDEEESDEDY